MIPTRWMCEQLWEDMKLPGALKAHMTAVADLSVRIGAALNRKGFSLDVSLLEAAALLHDIKKGTPHHAEAAAQTLEALGFSEIAPIVAAHMRLPEDFRPEITERTVVFLADKHFAGAAPVSLEKRYGEKAAACRGEPLVLEVIQRQLQLSKALERQIKAALGTGSLLRLP